MDDKVHDKVIAFDTLFTNNHIQMLKILMPYFDLSMQKNMAVYIKYQELMYTMEFFRKYPDAKASPLPKENSFNIVKLCSEIIPCCEPRDRGRLENMRNMFQQFQTYKDMMETIQMMKELFPEGENPMGSDAMSGMAGMGGGFDMSQMMGLFQSMSGGTDGSENPGGFDMSQMAEMLQAMSDISGDPDTTAASVPSDNDTAEVYSNEPEGDRAEKEADTGNAAYHPGDEAPNGTYEGTDKESQKDHANENSQKHSGSNRQQQNKMNSAQIIDMFKAMSGHNSRSETGGNTNGNTQ